MTKDLVWRETVLGEYWKAGPFRIEYIRGDFMALKFTANYRTSMRIGNYDTLLEAKAACQLEAPQ